MNFSHQVVSWPPVRNLIAEHLAQASKKNMIHSLFEVDVTEVLKKLKVLQRKEGKGYSFNAYLIYIFAESLNTQKELLAMRKGRRKLVVFDEIDIFVVVERKVKNQQSVPLGAIIRNAGAMTFEEINHWLRHYQKADPMDIPGIKERRALLQYPSFLRKIMFRRIDRNPFLQKKYYGTAGCSALTTPSGYSTWWGIPITASPVTLMPTSLHKKVIMNKSQPEERDFLGISVTLNHDTIDGNPAKRFFYEFANKLESGYGL